ncbi:MULTISPECIES: phosphoribosyl-AMP cyclohydrolase [Sinorhizobium]|uniref:Phosphoribosyl-AMP cyclohydrolase n=2 Tax=Sinorhizobium TaxID=28105 RepID=A0A1L3LL73_9HYPH|nr:MULTISPECIES: phosphoribosyl-AMP cyclohydrolase [Sinorhizobium]APG84300.1 phosphoribosyl-AMP cyclohydrolase HisI [Sinorhizobium americanum CCGM7]APG90848.1 phosphoribosyl-AMP cyclohydrolase HisI [Sinorhizobium americanum]ASY56140.1 Phosphoribosyl-AMP cyclohydrolase [Sinorhizobium sp. CCBAU 05631]AUX76067.1 phosphoribosyl-AMP cyclohydrolase [Sinorhizobium fredii]OAP46725.1 phosphoribosyl-AMP cyclohydrolase [Sinorhizobium americanum]
MTLTFAAPSNDKAELEIGSAFTPRFDEKGLVTAVVTDARDGELLMVAHMNAEALALTIETGIAHYFSRSRNSLWKKGESSGNVQAVQEIRTDCDQDAVWLKVTVAGHDATCHTGRRSCFYRTVGVEGGEPKVTISDERRYFDPKLVYAEK